MTPTSSAPRTRPRIGQPSTTSSLQSSERMVNYRRQDGGDDAARKRVFVPGYSGVISRMQETMAGTFAHVSRDSHHLVYKGCVPAMEAASMPSPDCFYQRSATSRLPHSLLLIYFGNRKPNPRIKTNAANRSNFQLGDERDWGFETLNEHAFKVPTKIPPRHTSIIPGGRDCSKEQLDHVRNMSHQQSHQCQYVSIEA